ncbi:hypothetical protein GYMLUDRAFT_33285 [Collybiopsis luxurians FD-317 M1]|nr:hypothetical protein GYMLUDRAFT_33285 [Collybiopsis luxurians FD-317 M1]
MSVHNSVQALFPRAEKTTLTLTTDLAIELILADIPLFSIGVLAVFYFAFLLIMKRVTLLSIYLYFTALFGFGAAVLDLAQILARGAGNVNANVAVTSSITAIINTREVGLSIAIGFRFLFFWAFVAERPRGEPPPTTDLDDPRAYKYYAKNSHSARWERWGYIGFVLKWLILAASLSIPILQIIWRIAVRHFSTVYMVESTIEILVSALFILKIFLNVFLSPVSPRWKPFTFYVAPLIALFINLAIGIGSLVIFLFSETALGRLLQALTVYVMILFLLVVAFYKIPVRPMRPRSSFQSPYTGEEKQPVNMAMGFTTDLEPVTFDVVPSATANDTRTMSRVSSWILAPRKNKEKQEDLEGAPGLTQLEITEAPSAAAPGRQISPGSRRQSTQVVLPAEPERVVRDSGLSFTPAPALTPAPADTSSVLLPTDKIENQESPSESRPSIGVSLRYYGVESRMSFPNPTFWGNDASSYQSSGTDSPVYGLNGIVNKRKQDRISTDSVLTSNRRPSMSSFDELIQQQAELDRSIAALRLFSPPEPSIGEPQTQPLEVQSENLPTDAPTPGAVTSPETANSNNRTLSTLTSSSARSDFSLSHFPDPPAVDFNGSPRASLNTMRAKRRSKFLRRDVPTSFDTGSVDAPSIPSSPTRLVPGRQFDSSATQYDVTSFIGNLTSPSLTKATESSEIGSPPSLRPLASSTPGDIASDLEPEVQPDTPAAPTAEIAAQDSAYGADRISKYPPLRPFFLGNITTPTVSSPLAGSGLRTPAGPRKPARGRLALPSQPRLAISGPRSRDDGIQTPGAFETPRSVPPPSFSTQ